MADTLPPQRNNVGVELEERTRDLLVTAGLQEILTYRLTTPEREAPLRPAEAEPEYVRLANPSSAERAVMRRTLLPGVLEVMALNARVRQRQWLFEIGPVFLPGPRLPDEPRRLAIGVRGPVAPASWLAPEPATAEFYALKGVVEALLAGLHIPGAVFEPADDPAFAPGRAAQLVLDGKATGMLGEVHPDVLAAFDLPPVPAVCAAEMDLEAVLARVVPGYRVAAVPRFPPALQDLAVVVDEAVPLAAVLAAVRTAGGPLLQDVRLFDLYRGPQVPPGKKSLAVSLAFLAPDRTLTDAEVEAAKRGILEALTRLGAGLRA
jgi:phenylalanyl-tRNA synthetase beta chain